MVSQLGNNRNRASGDDGAGAQHAHVEWHRPEYESVHVVRTVRRSVADVETILRVGPERLIELAYGKKAGTHGVVVPLGRFDWLSVPVRVESLTPSPDHHGAAISIRWQARQGSKYFPVMEADLGASSGENGATELVLEGRYRPPLGFAGLMFDQILGHRVASATAAHFVDRIANEIERNAVKLAS